MVGLQVLRCKRTNGTSQLAPSPVSSPLYHPRSLFFQEGICLILHSASTIAAANPVSIRRRLPQGPRRTSSAFRRGSRPHARFQPARQLSPQHAICRSSPPRTGFGRGRGVGACAVQEACGESFADDFSFMADAGYLHSLHGPHQSAHERFRSPPPPPPVAASPTGAVFASCSSVDPPLPRFCRPPARPPRTLAPYEAACAARPPARAAALARTRSF